jgi:hypothetical protein
MSSPMSNTFGYGYSLQDTGAVALGWQPVPVAKPSEMLEFDSAQNVPMLLALDVPYLNIGVPNNFNFDQSQRARGAHRFFTQRVTATGPTAIWTPFSGTRFCLMGVLLSVAGTLAAAGVLEITLLDGATAIFEANATLADTDPVGDTQIGCDFGQGRVSAAVDNVLRIELSDALVTGSVAVTVWGIQTFGVP